MMLMDRYLDHWDVRSRHETVVHASAGETYQAVRELDMGRSLPAIPLFAIRSVPHLLTGKARPRRSLTLDTFLKAGFIILAEEPGRELVVGAIGRFWRLDSGIERIAPEEFQAFDRPGFAKAALSFTLEEQGPAKTVLATETRVLCTDPAARQRFLLYWRLIGPFSGAIRRLMLGEANAPPRRRFSADRGPLAACDSSV